MGINIWIVFASILLVSAKARRYDQGPHTLYDFSTGLATAGPYGHRELILYLTPDQVSSLQADGAVVKSDKDDGNDSEISAEQQANEEQGDENDDENDDEQADEEESDDSQEENDDTQEVEENDDSQAEDAQQEEESPEERKSQNIDFEAILRLLNEEQVDEETAKEQPSYDPQIEVDSEEPRNFSPRFTFRRQQHEQKNVALAAAKKEQIFKTYSNIRYHPYGQRQRFNYQLDQQDYEARTPEEFDEKLIGTPLQGTRKYKLVPYKIEEPVEEPAPTVNAQQQNSEAEEEVQTAIARKRLRDELRKYALRVQKLKNSEKTKAEARANSKATAVPLLIKQQQNRKQSKTGKAPARSVDNKQRKPQQPKSIAVPVMMPEKPGVQKPIKVPVETSKLVRNKPYVATRKVTGNKKQNPEEAQTNNPERITILRQFRG